MKVLPALPTEIVENIVLHLEVQDLCSTRLVCKTIYQKGFRQSSSKLFKAVTTDLSRKSLERLQEISSRQDIAPFVQTLRVKPSAQEDVSFGQGFNWTRNDGGCLQISNEGLEIIATIVQRLKNCQSLHLFPSYEDEQYPPGGNITHSDCLFILFTVFMHERRQINSFHCPPTLDGPLATRGPVGGISFFFDNRRTPFLVFKKREVDEFRMNVTDLTLNIADVDGRGSHSFVQEFLSSVHTLLSLSLGAGLDEDIIGTLTSDARCHHLEQLCLTGLYLPKHSLVGLLAQCGGSLRSLRLAAAHLKGPETWVQLLAELPEILPALRYLSFARLFDDLSHTRKCWNTFPGLSGNDPLLGSGTMGFELYMGKHGMEWKVMGVTYKGREMGKAMDFIVRASEVI